MVLTDEYRFTRGDCHVLAKRIHRLTGWPLMAWHTNADYPDKHAFVRMPNGMALDVRGPQTPEQFNAQWNASKNRDYSWQEYEIKDFTTPWTRHCFGHYSYQRARIVADKLLLHPDVLPYLPKAGNVN